MMRTKWLTLSLSLAGAVALASPAVAQGRGNSGKVPPGHLPPAGMCRVWIDGVPPGRQPAPTDCATARRRAPRNSTILYGGDRRGDDRYGYDDRRDRRGDDDKWKEGRNRRGSRYCDAACQRRRAREAELARRDRNNYCVDNDRDGTCDWAERTRRADDRRDDDRVCVDRDNDGRCDWKVSGQRDSNDGGFWESVRRQQERNP